ncbi:MFS transporter [Nguyenibacter vanlangensis]|uniref:MFS transporter n=1 Tax=Nguyenibacter vanlangensis TaxID=1216886 RepID=A0A7Y7IU40_9PROT|nr:MFS transporter [Nguyenibacter vanlangensis]NVN10424.1 MFS transporter [Nguyenibacter vanlangensis]
MKPRLSVSGTRAKHIAAGCVGNFLEFYNFMAYAFFAPMIGQAFFPAGGHFMALLLALVTFAAGFIMRPLGACVIGLYTDRAGLGRSLMLSFLLMALGSVLLVFTPTYRSAGIMAPALILVSRLLQGFSEGGEVGPATDLLFSLGSGRQASALASMQYVTQLLASLAAVLLGLILSLTLSHQQLYDWGWRVPFVLGLAIVPIGFFFRRALPPMAGSPARPAASASDERRTDPAIVLFLFLAVTSGTITNYLRQFGVSYAIAVLHLPPRTGMLGMCLGLAAGIGAMGVGIRFLAHRPPARVLVSTGFANVVMAYPLYHFAVFCPGIASQVLLNVFMFASAGVTTGPAFEIMMNALSDHRRAFIFGVVYASAVSIFGGSTQPFVTWLIARTGDVMVPAYVAIAASPLYVAALLLLNRRVAHGTRSAGPDPVPLAVEL